MVDPRRTVALGCRIMAYAGLTEDVLGHISMRLDSDTMLLRCRGPHERGLLFTTQDDVHELRLDHAAALAGGYHPPHEAPLHVEILRARPEVGAVVHAHPRHTVLADLARLPLRPVFGAYHIPAYRMALAGVPVYPRSVLIATAELGRQLAAALGDADQCVLRGHGVAVVGRSVEEAVVRALTLEELARWTVELARLGPLPDAVPQEDRRGLPDLGAELNDLAVWRHHVARLESAGLGLD